MVNLTDGIATPSSSSALVRFGNRAYTYHYAYPPSVLIYKSGSTYMMKVDGVDNEISVKRLK
jgi:hypothetical protein